MSETGLVETMVKAMEDDKNLHCKLDEKFLKQIQEHCLAPCDTVTHEHLQELVVDGTDYNDVLDRRFLDLVKAADLSAERAKTVIAWGGKFIRDAGKIRAIGGVLRVIDIFNDIVRRCQKVQSRLDTVAERSEKLVVGDQDYNDVLDSNFVDLLEWMEVLEPCCQQIIAFAGKWIRSVRSGGSCDKFQREMHVFDDIVRKACLVHRDHYVRAHDVFNAIVPLYRTINAQSCLTDAEKRKLAMTAHQSIFNQLPEALKSSEEFMFWLNEERNDWINENMGGATGSDGASAATGSIVSNPKTRLPTQTTNADEIVGFVACGIESWPTGPVAIVTGSHAAIESPKGKRKRAKQSESRTINLVPVAAAKSNETKRPRADDSSP